MKRPRNSFPLVVRVIWVLICGALFLSAIYGIVDAVRRGSAFEAFASGACVLSCAAVLRWAVAYRGPNQEEYEQAMLAPVCLPDRDPIELDEPNWLVSRFLRRTGVMEVPRRSGGNQLECGAVAVDLKTN